MLLELTLVESITMTDLVQQLANELAVRPNQVEAAIRLIDEGASVPFIARYRKEVTQGLDDTQLRQLDTRLTYLRDLYERREKVIQSLQEQDKLSDDLLARVNAAETRTHWKKFTHLTVQNGPANHLRQKRRV